MKLQEAPNQKSSWIRVTKQVVTSLCSEMLIYGFIEGGKHCYSEALVELAVTLGKEVLLSYFVIILCKGTLKYSEDDTIKMLEFLVDNIFVVFAGKVFPADSRYSNGNKLCPSFSRHISLLI